MNNYELTKYILNRNDINDIKDELDSNSKFETVFPTSEDSVIPINDQPLGQERGTLEIIEFCEYKDSKNDGVPKVPESPELQSQSLGVPIISERVNHREYEDNLQQTKNVPIEIKEYKCDQCEKSFIGLNYLNL